MSRLQAQMAQPQYAALSKVKSQDAAISAQLSKLMAQDVAWYKLVPTLRSTAADRGRHPDQHRRPSLSTASCGGGSADGDRARGRRCG